MQNKGAVGLDGKRIAMIAPEAGDPEVGDDVPDLGKKEFGLAWRDGDEDARADDEGAGECDEVLLARMLATADAEIDSYLSARYTLPLSGSYPVLMRHACNMVRYFLSGSGVVETDDVRLRYRDAERYLVSVRDGLTQLGAEAGSGTAAPEAARIAVVGGTRVFTADTLAGFL